MLLNFEMLKHGNLTIPSLFLCNLSKFEADYISGVPAVDPRKKFFPLLPLGEKNPAVYETSL